MPEAVVDLASKNPCLSDTGAERLVSMVDNDWSGAGDDGEWTSRVLSYLAVHRWQAAH